MITTSGCALSNEFSNAAQFTIKRDSTDLSPSAQGFGLLNDNAGASKPITPVSFTTVDTPGDTSAHTYQLFMLSQNGSGLTQYMAGNSTATITLTEIIA